MSFRLALRCEQHLRRALFVQGRAIRHLSTQYERRNEQKLPPTTPNPPSNSKPKETPVETPPRPEDSWLTKLILSSPRARWWFNKVANTLGYGTPKQLAGRRTFVLYSKLCAAAPESDPDFWKNGAYFSDLFPQTGFLTY
jgi:cytochrome b pre-mRNA-processing protein 3